MNQMKVGIVIFAMSLVPAVAICAQPKTVDPQVQCRMNVDAIFEVAQMGKEGSLGGQGEQKAAALLNAVHDLRAKNTDECAVEKGIRKFLLP